MNVYEFKEYSKTLEISTKICEAIYPKVTTHSEWADRFNKIGEINRIIIDTIRKEKV